MLFLESTAMRIPKLSSPLPDAAERKKTAFSEDLDAHFLIDGQLSNRRAHHD
jgi:hypothetical protein